MLEDLEVISSQWDYLLELCADGELFDLQQDSVSAWSVGQQLAHVGIVVNLLASAIEGMLANPDQDAGLEPNEMGMAVLTGGEIPRGRGQAPDMLTPKGDETPDVVQAVLMAAKPKWEAFSGQVNEILNCTATFPHFALGNFTPAQWIRFNAIHTDHHLHIIRDIIELSGKPSPV